MSCNFDLQLLMQQALALAERGRGRAEPNPLVGAVVVDATGQVVGSGYHERYGGPHAEINALQAAGERSRGATLVVTLEPCCHYGKTPPCTAAIVRAGVQRVVAAMPDPFPAVAGRGFEELRRAGIEVICGVGATQARRLNAPYLKRISTGRPWAHAKWAMSLDGFTAALSGESRWITHAAARQRVHRLRGLMDAIVVGSGTVWADDPLLTVRPPGPRRPWRVVVTASGRLPPDCQLLRTAREYPTLVAVAAAAADQLHAWSQAGAEVLALPVADRISLLTGLLDELGRRQMTHVFIEGGPTLLSAFHAAGLIDEWHVFVAPKLLGEGRAALRGPPVSRVADAMCLSHVQAEVLPPDVYIHGYTPRPPFEPDAADAGQAGDTGQAAATPGMDAIDAGPA